MKKFILVLLLTFLAFSQNSRSYLNVGYNIAKLDVSGDAAEYLTDDPAFRVGLKMISSDWMHYDVEYIQYSIKEKDGDFEMTNKGSFIGFTPKITITLFDFIYLENGVLLAYQLTNKQEIKGVGSNSKQTTTAFRAAYSGEFGLMIPGGILLSAYYEHGLTEDEVFKNKYHAMGVRFGFSL